MNTPRNTVALLIDGDQLSPRHLKPIIQYCESKGELHIRRAYGAWNSTNLSPHCESLKQHGIEAVQQDRVADNATDFRMAWEIGSMLDKREADTYIIVSSDGDFMTHCQWIYKSGAKVIVIGRNNQTTKYRENKHIEFVDIEAIPGNQGKLTIKPSLSVHSPTTTKLDLLIAAYQKTPQANGAVYMAQLGTVLKEDSKRYTEYFAGKRLSTWLKEFSHTFEMMGDRVRMK